MGRTTHTPEPEPSPHTSEPPEYLRWPSVRTAARMLDMSKDYVFWAVSRHRPPGTLLRGIETDLGWFVDPSTIEPERARIAANPSPRTIGRRRRRATEAGEPPPTLVNAHAANHQIRRELQMPAVEQEASKRPRGRPAGRSSQRGPTRRPPAPPLPRACAAFRALLGIRGERVAERVGMSVQNLSHFELGKRAPHPGEAERFVVAVVQLAEEEANQSQPDVAAS